MSAQIQATPRVLIAANRLPITATRKDGAVQVRPSDGGLAAGLRNIALRWPVQWFGWNGLVDDSELPPASTGDLRHVRLINVALDQEEVERFYRRYCNGLLWPVLHDWAPQDFPTPADWVAYRRVNRRYSDMMIRQLQPGDRVWVHDYHLLLLPAHLRERVPGVPLAFFLHTPFPRSSEFTVIPQSDRLIAGMLGADVIGFHTSEYAQNFLESAAEAGYATREDEVRVRGRTVLVKSRPMGIDISTFAGLAMEPRVQLKAARLRRASGSLLLGVDRLDYTKGIVQRLLAFECLLERSPELRGLTTLMQVAVPTRENVAAYRDLRQVVEGIVARINRNFATPEWLPVKYIYDSVDLETLVSLYCAADVMLVTSQRDGLNLVAKEFVASRIDDDGVLILSRFAGAAEELVSALQVNPNRITELADAYRSALDMSSAERKQRMRQLRHAIERSDVFRWAAEFLEDVEQPAEQAVGA